MFATLDAYHSLVRGELERHEGTVEKFIGDAVVAVFGAPVAHDDDAERAARAGLAVLAAIDRANAASAVPGLQVRIGVATGEVLVNLAARPERGESLVAGDVVNTAARLQTSAEPGTVVVGERTCRRTREPDCVARPGSAKVSGSPARRLMAAGDQAADSGAAKRHYARAADVMGSGDPGRAEVLCKWGWASRDRNEPEQARQVLEEAAAHLQALAAALSLDFIPAPPAVLRATGEWRGMVRGTQPDGAVSERWHRAHWASGFLQRGVCPAAGRLMPRDTASTPG